MSGGPGAESPAVLLRRFGLSAKKSWGQCFLHDPDVVRRIVAATALKEGETVVEIGAGLGVLTEALAQLSGAGRIVAVERDRDLAELLRQRLKEVPRIELMEANALTLDLGSLGDEPLSVVGNLPYNISTPLLFHLLDQRQHLRAATLMFQKEVAARIAASPGSKRYGVPSVLCQRVAAVTYCFEVPRGCFYPAPRVDSAVIRLEMKEPAMTEGSVEGMTRVVKAAFSARRKTLRNALGSSYPADRVAAALEGAGIDPKRRAETLSVQEFKELSGYLDNS